MSWGTRLQMLQNVHKYTKITFDWKMYDGYDNESSVTTVTKTMKIKFPFHGWVGPNNGRWLSQRNECLKPKSQNAFCLHWIFWPEKWWSLFSLSNSYSLIWTQIRRGLCHHTIMRAIDIIEVNKLNRDNKSPLIAN